MYEKAAALLDGRREAEAARMLAGARRRLKAEEGFALAAERRFREAVPLLRAGELRQRLFNWRLALALMGLATPLARPVLRFYMRRHPFAGQKHSGRGLTRRAN